MISLSVLNGMKSLKNKVSHNRVHVMKLLALLKLENIYLHKK